MWKLFATAYPQEFREVSQHYPFRLGSSKKMSIRDYLLLVTSSSLSWATVLSISTEYIGISELVEIATVTNLMALDITSPPRPSVNCDSSSAVSLTDRVVRSWGESALAGGAFRHLRILMLRSQTEVTKDIFPFLDCFPSLVVLAVKGCSELTGKSIKHVASRHGWEIRQIDAAKKTIYQYISGHFLTADFGSETKRLGVDKLPLLEFSLESADAQQPEQQEHIWFYKQKSGPDVVSNSGKRKNVVTSGQVLSNARIAKRKLISKTREKKDITGLLAEFQRLYFLSLPAVC
jgi:hypothetical protein